MTYPHNIFKFDIQAPMERLDDALKLAFHDLGGNEEIECVGFKILQHDDSDTATTPRMIFFQRENWDMYPLITPSPSTFIVDPTKHWLLQMFGRHPAMQKQPDTDGSVTQGFRLYYENWETINGFEGSFCAIEPAWLVWGK